MVHTRRLHLPLALLLGLTAPVTALAEGTPDARKAEAAQRFDRGLDLFDTGDNAGALAEFQRVHELFPNQVVLYNIGLVYAAMRRPVEAVDALERVVAEPKGLSPKQVAKARSTLADQKSRIGRLSVTTKPEGARIEIDNVEVARTPLTAPLRVAEGSHTVGAVAEGYAPARKEVLVAGNAEASVALELVSSEGKALAQLAVRTRVPGMEVTVDGEAAGKTPLASTLTLVAGHHEVALRRPGYAPVSKAVDVGPGATGEITLEPRVDPEALGAEGATLALRVSEPGSVVFVDGESKGPHSGSLRVPRGPHRLRVEKGGFVSFEREVNVEPGPAREVRIELEPTAEKRASYESAASFHRTWGIVGVVGGAVIGGASALYLTLVTGPRNDLAAADRALKAAQDQVTNPTPGSVCDIAGGGSADQCNQNLFAAQSNYDSAHSKKQTHDILGASGIGVGVALVATGVVLLVTGDDPGRYDHAPSSELAKRSPGPRWALLPGPGQAGLALGAVF